MSAEGKLIAIVGPTASGKSALAMEVAKKYGGELICADSRSVYRGMDIGTAKPTKRDQGEVVHHLLDIVEPGQNFTVADFKRLADKAIDDVRTRGRLPILVGGTGLYIDAVIYDFAFGREPDSRQRAELESKTVQELQQIHTDLGLSMPENAANKRYLVRSLERGENYIPTRGMCSNSIIVGISTSRDVLLRRVIARTEQMMRDGVLDEARRLGDNYGWDNEAMSGNIYRLAHQYLEGELSLHHMLERFVRSDMNLAKRQMTWFRRNPDIIWGDPTELMQVIDQFVCTKKE